MIPDGKYTMRVEDVKIEHDEEGPSRVHFMLECQDSGETLDDNVALFTEVGPNILREKLMVLGFVVPREEEPGRFADRMSDQIVGREVEVDISNRRNKRGRQVTFCYYRRLVFAIPEPEKASPYPKLSEETLRLLRQTHVGLR